MTPGQAPSRREVPATNSGVRHARDRLRAWLAGAGLQVQEGPCVGGIAGCLGADGQPAFVYGEITGYWLSWAARYAPDARRMTAATAFIAEHWGGSRPAPTRHGAPDDWRNGAFFSFDLAMMLRGVADAAPVVGVAPARRAAVHLVAWLERLVDENGSLRSHCAISGSALPQRWSTRPGPYQAKTAAALLAVPADWLSARVALAARRTLATWSGRADEHAELHARCYALEGDGMAGRPSDVGGLMRQLRQDGSLPEHAGVDGGATRGDVQAQALRLLCLQPELRMQPMEAMASVLVRHVRDDGSVSFRVGEAAANVWCALFAHQALDWFCACQGDPAARRPAAAELV